MITLRPRAKIRLTDVARLRRWEAVDAPVAVVEINSLVALPRRYLVVAGCGCGEVVVSRHRSRACAVKAALRIANRRVPRG